MTITEFLEARIAEDEADAINRVVLRSEDRRSLTMDDAERIHAECAAKRAILGAHQRQADDDDPRAWIIASGTLLRSLATIYRDHPKYQKEWAS